MSNYQIGGQSFEIARTVELRPGQFKAGKPSQELQQVLAHNGADDVIWSQGDRLYLSSGRWTNDQQKPIDKGAPVKGDNRMGFVQLYAPEANTEADALAKIRDVKPFFVPGKGPIKGSYTGAVLGLAAGTVATGLASNVAERIAANVARSVPETVIRTVGYRAVEKITIDHTPKFIKAIAQNPTTTALAVGVATAGVVYAGATKISRWVHRTEQAINEKDYREALTQATRPPDYEMANQVGTPIAP